jgi:hypothetical protein
LARSNGLSPVSNAQSSISASRAINWNLLIIS